MQLSDGERLIAVMLADVMESMGVNRDVDPTLVKRLLFNRDEWALTWEYPGTFDGESPTDEVIKETSDILSMWSFIEFSIGELKGEDAEAAKSFPRTEFGGFDGNNDPHYGVAHTLINDLGRWTEFKDRPLNSHSRATLERYRRMLPKYKAAMDGWIDGPLPLEALRDILS